MEKSKILYRTSRRDVEVFHNARGRGAARFARAIYGCNNKILKNSNIQHRDSVTVCLSEIRQTISELRVHKNSITAFIYLALSGKNVTHGYRERKRERERERERERQRERERERERTCICFPAFVRVRARTGTK